MGRSLTHPIQMIEELAENGIGFRSLTEGMDATTAGGKLIFSIFGGLAEFEQSIDPRADDGRIDGCSYQREGRRTTTRHDAGQDQGGKAVIQGEGAHR